MGINCLEISSLSSNEYFGARNHPCKVSYKVNFKVGHNVKIQRGGDGFVGFVGPAGILAARMKLYNVFDREVHLVQLTCCG